MVRSPARAHDDEGHPVEARALGVAHVRVVGTGIHRHDVGPVDGEHLGGRPTAHPEPGDQDTLPRRVVRRTAAGTGHVTTHSP